MTISPKALRKLTAQVDMLKIACGMIEAGDDIREALPNLRDSLIVSGATPEQADAFLDNVQSVLDE